MESIDAYQLDFYDQFPFGFDQITSKTIRSIFPNPSLIVIPGEQPDTLFISTLLHGNETTSFSLLQRLEEELRGKTPKRTVAIFVGNVFAAEQNARFLPGGPDFNRIWNSGNSAAHKLAQEVLDWAKKQPLFANIDIHNNTGKNPFYGCISRNESSFIDLAKHFSDTMVFFENPPSVQSIAFSNLCPSVTIECGQAGNKAGLELAFQFVVDTLNCDSLAERGESLSHTEVCPRIFHTIGRVMIKKQINYEFLPEKSDVTFMQNVESLNFVTLEKGTELADLSNQTSPLYVIDDSGADVTDHFLEVKNRKLCLNRSIVPAMFTKDHTIIDGDCFGYFMEPYQSLPNT